MKKFILKGTVVENRSLNDSYYLLRVVIAPEVLKQGFLPLPGQFVQVEADVSGAFLRRPISVCDFNEHKGLLDLLVQKVGIATHQWADYGQGASIDLIAPLGKGFTLESEWVGTSPLLVGGGVGIAPLLYLSKRLSQQGITPNILLGARTSDLIVLEEEFAQYGRLFYTTEDGSKGERGFVTNHSVWQCKHSSIFTCGPLPMMKAVVALAKKGDYPCEVSLENRMACGIGACLCCVEKTTEGHLCACTEGPVFNREKLLWN